MQQATFSLEANLCSKQGSWHNRLDTAYFHFITKLKISKYSLVLIQCSRALMNSDRNSGFHLFFWPTVLIGLVLYFQTDVDMSVSQFFYNLYPGFQAGPVWKWVYHWATIPGLFVGLVSFIALIFQISPKWQKYRTAALMTFFSLIIGPLVLVNLSLKEHWVRPRPIQLEEYGGKYQYVPIHKIEFKLKGNQQKSFPSGHASMGFFLLVLWRIAAREKKRQWSRLALGVATLSTLALSWARLAQGGHFLSDVLISGYIVWLVILILEMYCYGKKDVSFPSSNEEPSS